MGEPSVYGIQVDKLDLLIIGKVRELKAELLVQR